MSFINPQDLKHTECVKLDLVFFYCVQIWLQVYFSCPYKSKNENKSDCTHCLKSPDWEGSSFSYGRVKCYKIIIRGKFTGGQELHCTCMNGKPGGCYNWIELLHGQTLYESVIFPYIKSVTYT